MVAGEVSQQNLVEASELLEIIEGYFDRESLDEVAINGLRVLLRESRTRIDIVRQQLDTFQVSEQDNSSIRQNGSKSLASRIKRLPKGESRTMELDLEPDFESI